MALHLQEMRGAAEHEKQRDRRAMDHEGQRMARQIEELNIRLEQAEREKALAQRPPPLPKYQDTSKSSQGGSSAAVAAGGSGNGTPPNAAVGVTYPEPTANVAAELKGELSAFTKELMEAMKTAQQNTDAKIQEESKKSDKAN